MISIVSQIDLARMHTQLEAPEAGGAVVFTGMVRNQAMGKAVTKLVFEAYEPMALSELEKIAARARAQWPLTGLAIQHVIGEKVVGELVVAVGAASAHRAAAFEACRFLIDELKQTVPIWKKEFYADSSIWVSAHP
ncbi:MAG: molybdenum cofactor biosynthesis protein MoaE [Sphingobacteriales bacterium]|nr:MAG: molybdenum cofactor biosynthesis protein MoaE [Sphingobacteriales bacterium]